jgi:putative ABC transport system permease protein
MLRTFGASKRQVFTGVVSEFAAIGLLAGVLAASGASLAAWLLATRLFNLEYYFSFALWVAGPLAGLLLVTLSGVVVSWRVVTHAPANVLRNN